MNHAKKKKPTTTAPGMSIPQENGKKSTEKKPKTGGSNMRDWEKRGTSKGRGGGKGGGGGKVDAEGD